MKASTVRLGDIVTITPSFALINAHLEGLAGRAGVITGVNRDNNGDVKGCWVKLDNMYENETEWYVPYISIV
jgi:hypothetical protein